MRRLALAAALVGAIACGCTRIGGNVAQSGGPAPGGEAPPPSPDRLVISTISDPKNLNPAFASATPTLELSSLLFSYAVRYDDKARPVPDAVMRIPTIANGDVAKDGLTITYRLRHGIKWHDGQGELTCVDMRSTWKMMVNPKNIIDTTVGWDAIKDIDCSDPYVAVVHMKHVYAWYLQQLWGVNGNSPILPAHIIDQYDDAKGSMNQAPFNSAPVGSGPYKFVSWQRGSEIRFAANPDYFLGKPKIAEIVYKIVPDGNTLATQVQTHEVNIAWNLAAAQYGRLKNVPGVTTIAPVVYIFDHIDFNLTRPLFGDVAVRRALTYAIDRPEMLDKIEHNLGELSPTFMDPTLFKGAYDPTVMQYPYDPARAKAMLDADGWRAGADGVRVKNGVRLAFQLSAQVESTTAHLVETQLQVYWKAIGAAVEIKNYPTVLFFDQTLNGVIAGGKFDVALYAWSGAPEVDQSAIYSGHFMPPHGQNYPRWNNARATAAMDDANGTVDAGASDRGLQDRAAAVRERRSVDHHVVPQDGDHVSVGAAGLQRDAGHPHAVLEPLGVPLLRRLAASVLAAACAFAATASSAQPARHPYTIAHVLRYATGEDIVGLNPHLNSQLTLSLMSSLTMAWLVRYDHANKPVPELATAVPSRANGGVSSDGKTITYHLRRDAKWSDGAPFTSADVVFSVGVVRNPANNEQTHQGFDRIVRVDAPDPYTVVFHMNEPYSGFYVNFFGSGGAQPCILPEHLLRGLKTINDAPYNALPVGIGPFKYLSWKRADSVELVADPNYFGRKPKLERIVFKIIPDRNTTLTQLTTHEIDLWALVPPAYYERVRSLPGVATTRQGSYGYNHVDLEMDHGALRDRAVRRALRLAIDRREIIEKIRHGIGILQETPFPPGHPLHIDVPRVPYDVAAANKLLDDAGWRRGPDGVRVKNRERLDFTFATGTGLPDTDQILELIRASWQQIGVRFDVKRYPSPLFFAPMQTGGIIYGGKFDLTIYAWYTAPNGDLTNLFASDRIPPAGQNIPRFRDAATDRALRAFITTYDPAKQRAASRIVQERIVAEVPTIVLDAREDVYAYNDDLRGFRPNQVTPFDDLVDADI